MNRKIYTEDDYVFKSKELNNIYLCSRKEGKKKSTFIYYLCKSHMNKGVQKCDWGHYRQKKVGCPFCSGRYKTTEDIIPLIKNKDVLLISEYSGNEKPIDCKCKKCGNIWTTLPKTLITNGAGCPVCGKIKAIQGETKSIDKFISELAVVNPNIEVIGEYKNTHSKILCRCKIDGCEWYGYPANLLNKSAGCPMCNISLSERKMVDILTKFGYNIVQQHTFDDCVYIHKLKFDAFDVDNNIAFEYNGEQHYKPIDFAGCGAEWAKSHLEITQKRDAAKIQYCKDHNIPIIIVPYWEKDNMEFFILNELKNIGENISQ